MSTIDDNGEEREEREDPKRRSFGNDRQKSDTRPLSERDIEEIVERVLGRVLESIEFNIGSDIERTEIRKDNAWLRHQRKSREQFSGKFLSMILGVLGAVLVSAAAWIANRWQHEP